MCTLHHYMQTTCKAFREYCLQIIIITLKTIFSWNRYFCALYRATSVVFLMQFLCLLLYKLDLTDKKCQFCHGYHFLCIYFSHRTETIKTATHYTNSYKLPFKSRHSNEYDNFFFCRSNKLLSERAFRLFIIAVALFPILFYIPKFFEVRTERVQRNFQVDITLHLLFINKQGKLELNF